MKERAVSAYYRMVSNVDFSNPEINYLSLKAKWMLNGGKTSKDWGDIPLEDINLMLVDYQASLMVQKAIFRSAIVEALNGKQDR